MLYVSVTFLVLSVMLIALIAFVLLALLAGTYRPGPH